MTKLIKRIYDNMGACPSCQSTNLAIYHTGPRGYFCEGEEVSCEQCFHEGVITEGWDGKESFMAVKWEDIE